MYGPQINRSQLTVTHNTLPERHLGHWMSDRFVLELRVKPAVDNTEVMIEVTPLFQILDAKTEIEMYRFQTATTYSFSGAHSKPFILRLAHHVINISIEEFNTELQRTKSFLAIHKEFVKSEYAEIETTIKDAFENTNKYPEQVGRHWKKKMSDDANLNDTLLSQLPAVPWFKKFTAPATKEQTILRLLATSQTADEEAEIVIRDSIAFNKTCFELFDRIDLVMLTDDQERIVKNYLRAIFTMMPYLHNDIYPEKIFRVTVLKDEFLENGKLRDPAFLSYPPLNLVRERGIYNRANSPNRTVFYGSIWENVALLEMKPPTGSRIVVSTWEYNTTEPMYAFPISLASGINNELADKASQAFEAFCENSHPLFAEWMEGILRFIANQFISDSLPVNPKRYDYLFSAFFSDKILTPFPPEVNMQSLDCILYPSVACEHKADNLAIRPEVFDRRFRLASVKESTVYETWYHQKMALHNFPCRLQPTRQAVSLENGKIRWNDDR